MTAEHRWFVRIDPGWASHDVRFYGDRWCKTDLVTVTENHGGGQRLTRVRLRPAATLFQKALWLALGLRPGPGLGLDRRGGRAEPAGGGAAALDVAVGPPPQRGGDGERAAWSRAGSR